MTDGRGARVGLAAARGLGTWLKRAAPARARGRVAIALVSDAEMRQLNGRFRRVRKATDVLSFGEPAAGEPGSAREDKARTLGNIAIARGVAARQAREQGHSVREELRILALHGLLHLLGYDHEVDRGEMARVEERLRRRAKMPAGLIGRASQSRPPR